MPRYPGDGRTADPTTRILRRTVDPPHVVYANADGDVWWILGTCAACGQCEVDGDGIAPDGLIREPAVPIGMPGAVRDPAFATRFDVPVRPELTWRFGLSGCTLIGAYITRQGG